MTLGPWVTAKTARVLEAAAQLDRLEGSGSASRIAHAEKLEGWAAKMMERTLSGHAKGLTSSVRESVVSLERSPAIRWWTRRGWLTRSAG